MKVRLGDLSRDELIKLVVQRFGCDTFDLEGADECQLKMLICFDGLTDAKVNPSTRLSTLIDVATKERRFI